MGYMYCGIGKMNFFQGGAAVANKLLTFGPKQYIPLHAETNAACTGENILTEHTHHAWNINRYINGIYATYRIYETCMEHKRNIRKTYKTYTKHTRPMQLIHPFVSARLCEDVRNTRPFERRVRNHWEGEMRLHRERSKRIGRRGAAHAHAVDAGVSSLLIAANNIAESKRDN